MAITQTRKVQRVDNSANIKAQLESAVAKFLNKKFTLHYRVNYTMGYERGGYNCIVKITKVYVEETKPNEFKVGFVYSDYKKTLGRPNGDKTARAAIRALRSVAPKAKIETTEEQWVSPWAGNTLIIRIYL